MTASPDDLRPFHDLSAYQHLPRLSGLALSPDGRRLVTAVSAIDAEGTRFRAALWEVDPAGERPARRLTRGSKGESGAAFTAVGDLLFTSSRPDPDRTGQSDDAPAALWRLPVAGEAEVVGTRAGGIGVVVAARAAAVVVATTAVLPSSVTDAEDEARRKVRKDKKVTGILHAGLPVRHWDQDLGPDEDRLVVAALDGDGAAEWRDLTPTPGKGLHETSFDVTPDGSTVVTSWRTPVSGGGSRQQLVAIDTTSGERQVIADDERFDLHGPVISPDGRQIACIRERIPAPTEPPDLRLVVLPIGSGELREVAQGWDRWANEVAWTPDGSALIVIADELGRSPVFRIELASGEVTRLTGDDGAYTDVVVAPDGQHVYALRSAIDTPPAPVRLDAAVPDQQPVLLLAPAPVPVVPGTLVEVEATALDGTPLRSWLALPPDASPDAPAPLLLWIHGGPLGSWNAWQWRWNPWLMTARGYAVLLPDPGLSTGYGLDFVRRGWGAWGDEPYTDLMAITDAAIARPDVDGDRTAAMGGSFGGYMANWVAGHTDRFRAIVTHASLWALDQFGGTTDDAAYWLHEMTPEMAATNSPHLHADAITTPMLVIHGDKDYRVPVGEALRLWWDLVSRHDGPPDELPHRYLYFPDENHWILTPNNAVVWYQTVTAFLDHHVLGKDWETPELLC
ncbi:prolyl oligopeptidase family serine peptidase [Pseudonocardia sp. TRM90224]|uniref:prolyl oligopeptidase family serine peptidase n=1 Tax=Pseudonocardia sp. TRM90224 TaxID=2812678 RepID=UPI001E33B4A4|nr:prolyl oligopeptidase family serine peptidase [Pseudonocardia sp. TRM90224]